MKYVRRIGLAVSALGFGMGILIACGDDDTVLLATQDGGGADQSAPNPSDSASDVANRPPPGDSGKTDAGDAGDEDPKDAQADVELPPSDSGAPDATPEELAGEFPTRLGVEMCQTVSRCCFGDSNLAPDAGVDGGNYDYNKCLNAYSLNGLNLSNPAGAAPERITFNPSKASECLSRIKVLSCNSNAAEYRAAVAACYGALVGTQTEGAACTVQGECQPGLFCNTAVGGGTCEAVRTAGAACGDWTTGLGPSTATCSNRLSGQPPLHCLNVSDASPPTRLPEAEWKCASNVPNGNYCLNDSWCSAGACPFEGPARSTCQDFIQLFTPTSCNNFVAK